MSYTSKTFNQTWDFNPDGDDLAAKTGRMLHTGVFGRYVRPPISISVSYMHTSIRDL